LIILLATTWTLDVDGVTDAADAVYAAANATRAGAAFVSHLLGALVAVHGPAATAVALPTFATATTWTLDVDGVIDAADAAYATDAAANATCAGAAFVSHLLGALVAVHGPAATAVALPTLSVGNCKAGKHNNPQQQQLVSARTCHLGGAFVLVGLVSGRADCWSVEVWNAWSYSD